MIRLNKVGGKALRQSLSLKNRKTHDDDTLTFYGKQYVHTHTHTHIHTQTDIHIYTKMPASCGHEITTNTCPSLSNLAR